MAISRFEYHADIIKTFPTVQAGVLVGSGIVNQPSSDALKELYFAEQAAVLARIGDTPLSELPSLSAWRGAFRQFGVNPTKYRSAIEALLRRLTKQGDIPSINTLVDIGNLVSIRHQVPVAVFDVARTNGSILVRFATGEESFTPLFMDEAEHPEAGEVIFMDGNDLVAARRWCWRQSDQSAARMDTTAVMIVTEAHHASALEAVQQAAADLQGLCEQFLGGEWASGVVNGTNPIFG
ncbi:MAG: B3/4 domain-containing protein [Anaerolineales bacterium]